MDFRITPFKLTDYNISNCPKMFLKLSIQGRSFMLIERLISLTNLLLSFISFNAWYWTILLLIESWVKYWDLIFLLVPSCILKKSHNCFNCTTVSPGSAAFPFTLWTTASNCAKSWKKWYLLLVKYEYASVREKVSTQSISVQRWQLGVGWSSHQSLH